MLIELFSWIDLIREQGIAKWRQEEFAKMGNIAFKFAEKQNQIAMLFLYPELCINTAGRGFARALCGQ